MLIIRTFCIIFSIRLGTLFIGVAYLVESFVGLILSLIWMTASTASALKEVLAEFNLLYVSDFLHRLSRDPSPYPELAIVISSCRVMGCAGVIYGSYYMKPFYLLPFLAVELVRLVFLFFLHITGMQIIKKNSQDLGLLIVATLAGSFLLCFLVYLWICVYSLFVVLRKISSKLSQPKVPITLQEPPDDEFPPRLFPAYYSSTIAPVY